jgi:hypothetical protein
MPFAIVDQVEKTAPKHGRRGKKGGKRGGKKAERRTDIDPPTALDYMNELNADMSKLVNKKNMVNSSRTQGDIKDMFNCCQRMMLCIQGMKIVEAPMSIEDEQGNVYTRSSSASSSVCSSASVSRSSSPPPGAMMLPPIASVSGRHLSAAGYKTR